LAIYGAVLSTTTFVWNMRRDLRDRSKLKISASVMRLVEGPGLRWFAVKYDFPAAGASQRLYIVLNVVNVGRRPMEWQGWGGCYKKPYKGNSNFSCVPTHLPKILAEQESHREQTLLEEEFDPDNIKKLFIWNSAGGEWKLSRRQLKNLIQEAKKARAPDEA
jgi:hypothetical protein